MCNVVAFFAAFKVAIYTKKRFGRFWHFWHFFRSKLLEQEKAPKLTK
jgi:hypothetical protein